MIKKLHIRSIMACLVSVNLLFSCGQQLSNTSKPVVDIPLTQENYKQSIEQIIQSACQYAGGDSDGDGICDDDERADPNMGEKCAGNSDCDNTGTPDGDDDGRWFDNPFNVALTALGSAALVYAGGGSYLDLKHKTNFVPGVGDKQYLYNKSGSAKIEVTFGNPLFSSHAAYSSRRNEKSMFALQVATEMDKETKIGNISTDKYVLACFRFELELLSNPDVQNPVLTSSDTGLAYTQLSILNKSKIEFLDKNTFYAKCSESTETGYWLAVKLKNSNLYFVKHMNPMDNLGFNKQGNTYFDNATFKFGGLSTYLPKFYFQNDDTTQTPPVSYTLMDYLNISSYCDAKCKMNVLLSQAQYNFDNMDAKAASRIKSFETLKN